MTTSPTQTTTARDAAQRLIDPWIRAARDRDWDALLSMCTDDIVFMPPGAPGVGGPDVRPWLEAFPPIKAMSVEIDDLEEMGDVAVVRGPVGQTLEIDGEDVRFDGKYLDVLRRGEDGTWRYSLIIWNENR